MGEGKNGVSRVDFDRRLMTELAAGEKVNADAVKYVNRLSDHLFVLARQLNDGGRSDVLWALGGTLKRVEIKT